jgi:hypothetical protein
VAARLRADLRDPQVPSYIAETVGIDPDRVKIKAPKVGHDPQAERQIRNGDPDGYDPRRSAGRRLQQWEQRLCERIDNDEPIDTPIYPGATVIDLSHFRAQQEDSRAPNITVARPLLTELLPLIPYAFHANSARNEARTANLMGMAQLISTTKLGHATVMLSGASAKSMR